MVNVVVAAAGAGVGPGVVAATGAGVGPGVVAATGAGVVAHAAAVTPHDDAEHWVPENA